LVYNSDHYHSHLITHNVHEHYDAAKVTETK